MRILLPAVALLLLIPGCASVPQYIPPDGVTEETQRKDTYQCKLESKTATQGGLANPRYRITTMMILQSHEAQSLMNECMVSKGYKIGESKTAEVSE
jgi:uncharacterized lipoprotein YajG